MKLAHTTFHQKNNLLTRNILLVFVKAHSLRKMHYLLKKNLEVYSPTQKHADVAAFVLDKQAYDKLNTKSKENCCKKLDNYTCTVLTGLYTAGSFRV